MRRTAHSTDSVSDSIAYIFGRIENQIEAFALRMGIPAAELAHRVGTLLSAPAVGQVLGPVDRLPDLRQTPGERDLAVEPLALAGGAHRVEAPAGTKPKAGNSSAYWAKMTPRERVAEQLRRALKAKNPDRQTQARIKSMRATLRAMDGVTAKHAYAPVASATQRKSGYWAEMRPIERSKEMLRRLLKGGSKHPKVLTQIKALRAKIRALKAAPAKKHGRTNLAKQLVYQRRHAAKNAGLRLPPREERRMN